MLIRMGVKVKKDNAGFYILKSDNPSGKNMKIGDVLVFKADTGNYLIHRIISLSPLATKGDSNDGQLDFEKNIRQDQIVGLAAYKAPYLGYPSKWLTKVEEVIS